MSTLADINAKITSLTGTDTNAFANSDRLIDLNLWNQKIVGAILDSQDETDFDDARYSDYPILTQALSTNRDYYFTVSLGVLKIKSVSVSYDGVNFYKATPFDDGASDYPIVPSSATTANTNLDANFAKTNPRYDIKFGAFWLYPLATAADVAAGGSIIVETFRAPLDFTSTDLSTGTAIPGFDSTFHMMLAYGVAFEYASAKSLPQLKVISAGLADYEQRLRRQYSSKQLDRNFQLMEEYQSYK